MTVQIVEIAGQKMAVLPVADYERLLDVAEDRADAGVAGAAEQRRRDGEDYLPATMVDRMLGGEHPLKVWRIHRGWTQRELASRSGQHKMTVSRLELGKQVGSSAQWRALAAALNVTIDDVLPIS